MTSPPAVTFAGRRIELEAGESVLDGLLREGADVGHSCRSGHCHACLVRGDSPPPAAQTGLKAPLVAQGYFLACQARPKGELEVFAPSDEEGRIVSAVVVERATIGPGVLRLRLTVQGDFEYRPGQFVHVLHPSGALRSYSLASSRDEPYLELHVRLVDGGLVSSWLHQEVEIGETLRLRGPHGSCFYVDGSPDQPLVLAGAGTGMAPLRGIVRDALAHGHTGPIHVIQGALDAERLYLLDELDHLCEEVSNVEVHYCALRAGSGAKSSGDGGRGAGPRSDVREGALDQLAADVGGTLRGPRAFLCGDPALVKQMQRKLFLAGVASDDILADPFLPSPSA